MVTSLVYQSCSGGTHLLDCGLPTNSHALLLGVEVSMWKQDYVLSRTVLVTESERAKKTDKTIRIFKRWISHLAICVCIEKHHLQVVGALQYKWLSVSMHAFDTQLFFSFYPSVFDSSITQLQHSLQQISSWMTTHLLTLSSSKTEFLLQ